VVCWEGRGDTWVEGWRGGELNQGGGACFESDDTEVMPVEHSHTDRGQQAGMQSVQSASCHGYAGWICGVGFEDRGAGVWKVG
jgi:hypothetical protein